LPNFIQEHARLDWAEPIGWATLALGAVYVATLIGVWPRWPRIVWLVPLVWLVLATLRVRNVPLFGVTAVIALADMLPYSRVGQWLQRRGLLLEQRVARPERAWQGSETSPAADHALAGRATQPPSPPVLLRAPTQGWSGEGRSWSALFLPFVAVAAAALLQVGGVRVPVVGRDWARFDPAEWPVELLPQLDEINRSSEEGARIFNDMNFGGFLIYHTPRLRIFVDDRCPLYGAKFLLAYNHARQEDPAQIDQWQRQYGFRYALVEATGRTDGRTDGRFDRYLSGSAGWTLVDRSPAAALYRHE
jgi:hypothetical protein